MFRLAELFVDIRARDESLQAQVSGVKGQLSALGLAVGTAVGTLAAGAIARASSELAAFIAGGIKGAVDLKETLSKVNVIFGENASIITRQADEMAAKFGVVKGEFLNAASDFGSAFKAIGVSGEDAAETGNALAKLAMDMASFNNTSNEQAFTALRAALRGEFDPLERFNVMLSAAAIEQEALDSGLIKTAKDLDESAKKQATFNLIMRKTVDQQGDMERTADGSANSWRKFAGTLENLATSIGSTLEPAINAIASLAGEMASDLAASFEASKGAFEAFADGVVSVVRTIGVAWRNLPDLWEIVVIKAREMGINLLAVFESIPINLNIIGEYIANNWRQLIADGLDAVGKIFTNLAYNVGKFAEAVVAFLRDPTKGFQFDWTPLLDGFKATADRLPELARPALVSLQDEIDRVAGRIADREGRRAAEIADRARAAARPAQQAAALGRRKADDFKSETSGIAEFAMKLRADIYADKDDTAKKSLEEQAKIRAAAEKIVEIVGGGMVATLG